MTNSAITRRSSAPWPTPTSTSPNDRSNPSWQVWWVDFNPQVGHEQAVLRPAVVLSTAFE
ncbi:type II toxin-antitoxin system PemK/MazF family toxin [Halopolyspora algeriensis]|uniref:type II toxin-antitoxin system PemK/MazF family toxin n=1 Tax=Halopolyspora algeriensis TaxID=1500506 RepID=UPI000DF2DD06